jgi:chromosome segregation ATPase
MQKINLRNTYFYKGETVMKDGFDKNVAEKMPKIQKVRPNRPWNINPVQLPARSEDMETAIDETQPFELHETNIPVPESESVKMHDETKPQNLDKVIPSEMKHTEKTLKEIDSQFTSMIIEKKEAKRLLGLKEQALEDAVKANLELKRQVADLQSTAASAVHLNREVDFLNEQIMDANIYIQGLLSSISEKDKALNEQISLKQNLQERFAKIGSEVKDKALLDVKAAILERDLNASHQRIKDLETILEEEDRKRKPLEDEIVELKSALEQVHASLAQIRLKAKREAYGL